MGLAGTCASPIFRPAGFHQSWRQFRAAKDTLWTAVLGYSAAMVRLLLAAAHGLRSLLRSQMGLAIENAALRQQLADGSATKGSCVVGVSVVDSSLGAELISIDRRPFSRNSQGHTARE